jgi:hypothetical protein
LTTKINTELLNRFFVSVCSKNNLSIIQIKYLVDTGIISKINIDMAYVVSCQYDDIQIVTYFLHDCDADINMQNSYALTYAFHYNQYQIAKFLLESDIYVTDEVINKSFDNEQNLKLLLDNGIDIDRIAKIYIKNLFNGPSYRKYMSECAKILIGHGIDFNQYILNYQQQ